MGQLFAWMHGRRAASVGKTRWTDKTPSYALRLPFINSLFPDCQVIHIIRNPLDVIDSLRRKDGFRYVYRNAQMWESHVRRARNVGTKQLGNRCFELRYEELVRPRALSNEEKPLSFTCTNWRRTAASKSVGICATSRRKPYPRPPNDLTTTSAMAGCQIS